jgi:hypothetical protein
MNRSKEKGAPPPQIQNNYRNLSYPYNWQLRLSILLLRVVTNRSRRWQAWVDTAVFTFAEKNFSRKQHHQVHTVAVATCSRWFLARGFFWLEDGGDSFIRNVRLHNIYTAPHPRRRHSSYSPPWKPQILHSLILSIIWRLDISGSYSYKVSPNDADSKTRYSNTKTHHTCKTCRNAVGPTFLLGHCVHPSQHWQHYEHEYYRYWLTGCCIPL